ncbi:MAG TPA: CopG family ribbon-helix-helix protein [Candidatus Methanofastidiosa archaeon]|nr:CopG family ribbon-helix-helix protein [Candidatus Methanofastidiosa archaeon]
MTVVSVSLNDKILSELDMLQENMGFSGRSEVIRAGVRMLLEDYKSKRELTGDVSSVLLLIHEQKHEGVLSDIKHDNEGLIHTQIHTHVIDDRCLEIFVLKGKGEDIREMVNNLQISGKMDYINLVVT